MRRPTHEPRAHTFVPQVVALAAALLERRRGVRERRQRLLPRRGRRRRAGLLPRRRRCALLADNGGRLDDPAKHDPLDQAVWQSSDRRRAGLAVSPWGPGRPGWHAECTAMALSTYGPSLDLHAGGADLRFPHHAYEAAQAEAATGVTPFARSWLHVGTVRLDWREDGEVDRQPRVRARPARAQ